MKLVLGLAICPSAAAVFITLDAGTDGYLSAVCFV